MAAVFVYNHPVCLQVVQSGNIHNSSALSTQFSCIVCTYNTCDSYMIETKLHNLLLAVLCLCFQRLLLSEFLSIFQLGLTPSAVLLQITSDVLHTTIIPCSLVGELF